MSIKTMCNTNVVTIQKMATLREASKLMQKHHVGSLIVIEAFNGGVIPSGIITDRDMALSLSSIDRPGDIRVEQIMQANPVTVKESEGIYDVIIKMYNYGIKRLPVVHEDGSLFGIVTADDILSLMGEEISSLSQINETQLTHEKGIIRPAERHIEMTE